jgi:hypothetical protein
MAATVAARSKGSTVRNDQATAQWLTLAKAKTQLAGISGEFRRGLSTVNDPVERKRLVDAYTKLIQNYGAKVRARSRDMEATVDDGATFVDPDNGKATRPHTAVAAAVAIGAALLAAVIAVRAMHGPNEDEYVITPPEPESPAQTPTGPAAEVDAETMPPAAAETGDL